MLRLPSMVLQKFIIKLRDIFIKMIQILFRQ
nr:MAG TPA: hypothetical protein [Caudoviricetes sp.]